MSSDQILLRPYVYNPFAFIFNEEKRDLPNSVIEPIQESKLPPPVVEHVQEEKIISKITPSSDPQITFFIGNRDTTILRDIQNMLISYSNVYKEGIIITSDFIQVLRARTQIYHFSQTIHEVKKDEDAVKLTENYIRKYSPRVFTESAERIVSEGRITPFRRYIILDRCFRNSRTAGINYITNAADSNIDIFLISGRIKGHEETIPACIRAEPDKLYFYKMPIDYYKEIKRDMCYSLDIHFKEYERRVRSNSDFIEYIPPRRERI